MRQIFLLTNYFIMNLSKRNIIQSLTCAIITLLTVSELKAQPFCEIDVYNIHDGLPSNYVSAMTQTSDGLIWVATWNGLCYHDGYRFVGINNFRHSPSKKYSGTSLPTRLTRMAANGNGDLWFISSDSRLYHLATSDLTTTEITPRDQRGKALPVTAREIFTPTPDATWITSAAGECALRIPTQETLDTTKIQTISSLKEGHGNIVRIFGDSKKREWVFTDRDTYLYGTKVQIKSVFYDFLEHNGVVYFAGKDGLMRFNEKQKRFENVKTSVPAVGFRLLKSYDKNRLMMADGSSALIVDPRTGSATAIETSSTVSGLHADKSGGIWIMNASDGILYARTPTSRPVVLQSVRNSPGCTTSSRPIWFEDDFGTIWVLPRGGVFSYFDKRSESLVPYPISSTSIGNRGLQNIEKFFLDREGNLWASSVHDLALITPRRSTLTRSALDGQEARSILPLKDGGYWVGTTAGHIAEFDSNGNLRRYIGQTPAVNGKSTLTESATPIKFAERIYALFCDKQSNIWVGTKGVGLYRISGSSVTNYRDNGHIGSLSCDTVYAFDQDEAGNIWIGTYGGGLNKAVTEADGSLSFLNFRKGLASYPIKEHGCIRRITHDGKGTLLLSTTRGLVTFSNCGNLNETRYYASSVRPNDPSSLHNANVMQTLIAPNGNIYAITLGGGLQRLVSDNLLANDLRFEDCNPSDTPGYLGQNRNSGNMLSIIADKNGNLCAVSEVQLNLYMPKSNSHATLGANNFGVHNEFTEAQPVYNAASGQMLIGVIGGVIGINADDLLIGSFQPPVVFTSITYQGDTESHSILNTSHIEIPSDKRDLAISFSALDYASRSGIEYCYMLEGVDKDWTYLGHSNTARLSRLKAGTHKLLVRACNNDGIWMEEPAVLEIRCLPTFWETPWAVMLYVLLSIGLMALATHTYTLRKKNAMRVDMDRMKNKFYTDASHRLRTPLTLIGGPAAELLKDPNLSEESRENVEMLLRNSNKMLAVVNHMLSYAREHQETTYISDESVPEFDTLEQISDQDNEVYREFFRTPAGESEESHEPVTILIVEDNDDLRTYLANILRSRYNILTAPNGLVGLHIAEERQPDFILTDVMMPEMDGLTMVHHIKKSKALSHIPIVVLSAKASMADRVQGLKEGIDDYITKPFTAGYLKQRIANIVSRRHMLRQRYLEGINLADRMIPVTNEELTHEEVEVELVNEVVAAAQTASDSSVSTTADGIPAEETETAFETLVQENPEPDEDNAFDDHARAEDYSLEEPQIADADHQMMDKLLKFIEQRIDDESLKIEELAESVNLGRTVFYGKIKSLVGMSPSDFLRHLRLKRAEELITKSKMNLSQIAFNVGFSDPKYFTKCFKKEMGMTPSQYRQNARKNL